MENKRLIDANVLQRKLDELRAEPNYQHEDEYWGVGVCMAGSIVDDMPTVDAVSGGVHDQVRWERDVAIQQLEEHGIPFGGIAPDVVKVVHGRWGKSVVAQTDTSTLYDYTCSICSIVTNRESNYCPYCGAKMDGDWNG